MQRRSNARGLPPRRTSPGSASAEEAGGVAGSPPAAGRGGYGAVAVLGILLAITAAWWGLALWPLPETTPEWLLRTRVICFGSTHTGLPDTAGWLALVLQPFCMVGTLFVGWGGAVIEGARRMVRRAAGQLVLGAGALAIVVGLVAAAVRVAGAGAQNELWGAEALPVPFSYPRLDRAAPPLDGLVDQHGQAVALARFRGRPLLVTFAYAHCSTVCPLIVRDVLSAQGMLRGAGGEGGASAREPGTDKAGRQDRPPSAEGAEGSADAAPARPVPAVLIVTLDPWRDTPARLPAIALSWELGEDAYVASGEAQTVTEILERWDVAWSREERTGEIAHAPVVFLVDAGGMIAYAASGSASLIVELAGRL
ncbi:MAG: SCO family protein [Gemmatimonadetes bacterium]|nr:SCO family protein [Gemmatimonadota bacterium]